MRHVMRLGGAVALLSGLALLVTSCGSLPGVAERANTALKEARFDQAMAEWDAQQRVLALRGFVMTAEEREQAAQVAASVVGSGGTVRNELAVTLRGAPAPAPVVTASDELETIDHRIHHDVEALFADTHVWKGREFEVLVHAGQVRLTGHVLSQEEKDRVTEMVTRVAGVSSVINRLEIRNPAGPGPLS